MVPVIDHRAYRYFVPAQRGNRDNCIGGREKRRQDCLVLQLLLRQQIRVERVEVRPNVSRETLINGPTSEVAGEMASNFLDDEANRRSIQ
ncbi:hypothetical protein CFB48_37370 [Burkholderia sp. AU33647]|nr:hypothetical protein CFB48_37370 [Burkholderia sp. AU33647]